MSGRKPPTLGNLFPELRNIEHRRDFRTLVGSSDRRLDQVLNVLAVEHAQIKSDRLRDPRFEHYYQRHRIQFLDVIERMYLVKLNVGQISLDEFFEAMKGYVTSRYSGSQGRQRQREADHIIDHILAQLVRNYRLNQRRASKPSKNSNRPDFPRPPRGGPDETPLERSLRESLQSDERKQP